MNEQHLDRYAEILVRHGAGLRADQDVFIHGEIAHRDLALRVAEAAYDQGAGSVSLWLDDPLVDAQLIRRGRPERIELAHEGKRRWINGVLKSRGALISLRGDEHPTLMPEIAESHPLTHQIFTRSQQAQSVAFHLHGINRGLCPWVVAGAPTPAWAMRVRPALADDPATAAERLAELIFSFTHADREDAVDRAAAKDRLLHARRRALDALAIEEIHVTGGGSDLRVGLSPKARWLGGSKETAFGQTFNANVPSEENFTTPDWRRTEGRLAATMPFRTKSGVLVEDLVLSFRQGRVVDFEAGRGREGFGRWLDSDEGARQLGEFALVGQDSPIAASGRFFEHTLFDENAWSHAALGKAYATALRGGPDMTPQELKDLGCNDSVIHTDIMFGSTEVSIVATRSAEGEVVLIEEGAWTARFREA